MIKEIGKMIQQMRTDAKISQKELGRGLLSIAELSRLESGEKEPDSFLLTALIQRLGKSMDRFEMVVSNDEYKMILLRAFLQENMLKKDFMHVEELIEKYENFSESKKIFHQQYVKMLRSVVGYLKNKDAEQCIFELEQSLKMTFLEEQQKDWKELCFYTQELQIMMLISYLQIVSGHFKEAVEKLNHLTTYIENKISYEEAKVRIYPKCCYLLAKAYVSLGELEKSYEISGKGIT